MSRPRERGVHPFHHVLYMNRGDIVDLHRKEVSAFFSANLSQVRVSFADERLDDLPLDADCVIAPAAAWVGCALPRVKSLRWIHFTGSGLDAVSETLQGYRDLLVSTSKGVNAAAIAEFALAGLLYFAKAFDQFTASQRAAAWNRRWLWELEGRRLLILGAGAVGGELALRARAFGLRPLGIARRFGDRPHFEAVFGLDALAELLPKADFVACTLPLTPVTRGAIGDDELRLLPKHAVLVQVGRGGVIDELALARALKQHRFRGAVLDVFEQEPLPSDSPLWHCPSLLITPHVAGTSDRYLERMLACFHENWCSLMSSGELRTPFSFAHHY